MLRAVSLEGKESELNDLLHWVAHQSRQEEGCVEYRVHQEENDPRQFIVLERWGTKTQHDIHLTKSYVVAYNEAVNDLVETSRADITSILRGSGKPASYAPGTLPMF